MLCCISCIPKDVWVDMALELLDARDLMRVDEAMGEEAVWSTGGAVFSARRVLSELELQWFARRGIPLNLLEKRVVGAPSVDDGINVYCAFSNMRKDLGSTAATTVWTRNGELHRTTAGGPAVESRNDSGDFYRAWYDCGKLWRADGLHTTEYGRRVGDEFVVERQWFNRNFESHREDDLPSFEDTRGNREWHVNGERHRDGGRPAIEGADGRREWWTRGRRRTSGGDDEPTLVTARGDRCWYAQAKLHEDEDDVDDDCGGDEDSRATLTMRSECSEDTPEELMREVEQFKATHGDWMSVQWKADVVESLETRLAECRSSDEDSDEDGSEDNDEDSSDSVVSGAAALRHDLFDRAAADITGRRYAAALHRGNDKPAIECQNGDRYWLQRGRLHRDDDLPAVEYHDGGRAWFQRGKRHRLNGPAVMPGAGGGVRQWYLDGTKVPEEEEEEGRGEE